MHGISTPRTLAFGNKQKPVIAGLKSIRPSESIQRLLKAESKDVYILTTKTKKGFISQLVQKTKGLLARFNAVQEKEAQSVLVTPLEGRGKTEAEAMKVLAEHFSGKGRLVLYSKVQGEPGRRAWAV